MPFSLNVLCDIPVCVGGGGGVGEGVGSAVGWNDCNARRHRRIRTGSNSVLAENLFFNFPFVYSSCLYMFINNADSAGEHLIMSIFNYLDDWMRNKLEALEGRTTQKIKEQFEYLLETNYKHVTLTDFICRFN